MGLANVSVATPMVDSASYHIILYDFLKKKIWLR
jgi:hypothetical protein